MAAQPDSAKTMQEARKGEVASSDVKKSGKHRRRHRRPSNRTAATISEASTRSGSPSSSPSITEAALSRRGSADTFDSDRALGPQNIEVSPPVVGTPPRAAPSIHAKGLTIAGTSPLPLAKPPPLKITAIGDASQRQPMSRLGTPVTSPTKQYAFPGGCGGQLILPSGPLIAESLQCSPAGTPAATPVSRYNVVCTSPTKRGSPPGAVWPGDASQRTPTSSPLADQNTVLKSWLCGSPCGKLPSEYELAEILRAALPEAYDD